MNVIGVPALCGLARLLVKGMIVSGPLLVLVPPLVVPPPLLPPLPEGLVAFDEPDTASNNVNCCI